ncbi:MAG: FHIPEP family type III secretion protein [Candidatus Riflebacteria bacterium]|nr:FHIPEP family type III secretion protein [Candidatus Riflebacteria bacterium]
MSEILKKWCAAHSTGLIAVILILAVPIPPDILNNCLLFNIALAASILLITTFIIMKSEFSGFPVILLFTTLFRFVLNICSMRAIFCGYGAEIKLIKTFGQMVVGGNYMLGIIIFNLLVIIQFIVITNSSERVAEGAARFTLDAMPNKRKAIDADLDAGIITNEEAGQRRKHIEREVDFYELMAGTTKFVKIETIAGIIIVFINIVGGLIIGIFLRGEPVIEAAKYYTLYTIGAGLATQLPALLITTATGIVVTNFGVHMNSERYVSEQPYSQTKLLFICAFIMFNLGMIPGLSKNFTLIGAIFGIGGCLTLKREIKATREKEDKKKADEEKNIR